MIKQELTLSDVEQDDDIRSNDDNYIDDDSHMDSQIDVPFTEEMFLKQQQLFCDRPKLFECYLCHKSWQTVGMILNSLCMVTTHCLFQVI